MASAGLEVETQLEALKGGRVSNAILKDAKLPTVSDYYEPWTYDYDTLISSPPMDTVPVARPKSMITGKDMEIRWGANWDDDLGGAPQRVAYSQRHPWTLTPDSDFVIDRRGSLVLACGCSGHAFKFGPALGAAKLAQMAVTGSSAAEVCTRPPVTHVIEPDPALADRLAPKLERFRRAYAAIKDL